MVSSTSGQGRGRPDQAPRQNLQSDQTFRVGNRSSSASADLDGELLRQPSPNHISITAPHVAPKLQHSSIPMRATSLSTARGHHRFIPTFILTRHCCSTRGNLHAAIACDCSYGAPTVAACVTCVFAFIHNARQPTKAAGQDAEDCTPHECSVS